MTPAPAFATPAATVPTPASDTSFTEILALVFANFVLTALLMFTVLPETKKANKMIEDVCNAVDLELNSGVATGLSNTSIDKIKAYTVNGGEKMTMSFANGDDNKQHFLVATISLSMNTESENFKTYGESIAEKDSIIKSSITDIVHKYTMDEFEKDRDAMYNEILKEVQNMFGGDFIVSVNFSDVMTQ